MTAKRDRSGLTAKEKKIVFKKSRTFDSNTQGLGLPQKSSKATIKAASVKKSSRMTAKERGFEKDKASRKEMKKQDIFYNRAGKADLKEGYRSGAAIANTPKSQNPSQPKVPVKPKGGRGGSGGGLRIGQVR